MFQRRKISCNIQTNAKFSLMHSISPLKCSSITKIKDSILVQISLDIIPVYSFCETMNYGNREPSMFHLMLLLPQNSYRLHMEHLLYHKKLIYQRLVPSVEDDVLDKMIWGRKENYVNLVYFLLLNFQCNPIIINITYIALHLCYRIKNNINVCTNIKLDEN